MDNFSSPFQMLQVFLVNYDFGEGTTSSHLYVHITKVVHESSPGRKCMSLGSNSLGTELNFRHLLTVKLCRGHLTSLNLKVSLC